jgi:glyoxylase-like metal-dependent hydrolase (beta-lactamase superfamily II)
MPDLDFSPVVGALTPLVPKLGLVLAPNPSPMTGQGTNTYLLGHESLAVIDPGPQSEAHLAALLSAINGRPVSHIIVTHSHLDHSPLARPLADAVGAPILAFGDTFAGRSAVMAELAKAGMAGGGEGLDHTFKPDLLVKDGDIITGQDWTLEVIHTPGHLGNHIALGWEDAVFVGDLVMGWSTSLVSPPDGDMTDFLSSCEILRSRPARVHYSGHGAPITTPHARLTELINHRGQRAAQITAQLAKGPHNVVQIVDAIYQGLDPRLAGAAGRNVFAHLVDLYMKKQVRVIGDLGPDAVFEAVL